MFKILNQKNGQSSMSQYVLVFFMAIGSIVAMTTFIQRTLQARIRDTRNYMLDNVKTYGNVTTNMHYEYEPYYSNTSTIVGRSKNEQIDLVAGGATGIFRKNVNSSVSGLTNSVQAPPRDAR
jgi:hypothetical protein